MRKSFILGAVSCLILIGCISAQFNYNWFYPELLSYDGKLLGKRPSEDLDAKICAKDVNGNHGCVVMLKHEFQDLYSDYLDTKNRLIRCERGR